MGKKIFVSYKYADSDVENLNIFDNSTVRNYVDLFEQKINSSDSIFKGESEGEDLSGLSEDVIWEILKNRIYDSSVTVVFISPNMRDVGKGDRDQWIPWEISYSLKETSRKNKNGDSVTSHTNAMLAVVLPDESGSYTYYLEPKHCCTNGCIMHHTSRLFTIMRENMFNLKKPDNYICNEGDKVWRGACSYIKAVKWVDFMNDYKKHIDEACSRQENLEQYTLTKEV